MAALLQSYERGQYGGFLMVPNVKKGNYPYAGYDRTGICNVVSCDKSRL